MAYQTPGRVGRSTLPVPDALVSAMRRLHSPIVITHVVPDADALGSTLGLARAWASDRCTPRVALPAGSLSQRLGFMPGLAKAPMATPADFGVADGFVVLDTAKKERCNVDPSLRETDWSVGRPVLSIDHHETNTLFGDVNWVVGDASSVSELVYHLLNAIDRPIDERTASLLYAGIQTDTVGFSLANVTASSLNAAADLVACGADVTDLGERLCRSQHQSEFDLLRVIYANTRLAADGQLAYSSANYDEIHGAGCTAADIDDQINVPRSLCGVRLAMLFTEGLRGKTRINFRGSGGITVLDLASEFGGGGHKQAAGAVLDDGLESTVKKVVPRAVEYLRGFPPQDGGWEL